MTARTALSLIASSKTLVFRIIALIQRHPGVVAIFGFLSGVASFVLVDRQAGLAKVLALVLSLIHI